MGIELEREDRDCFSIQAYRILRDKSNVIEWEKLSAKKRAWFKKFKYFTRFDKYFKKVNYKEFENEEKLAEFVRKNYGYGEFGIMFYSRMIKSKKYNPSFRCNSSISQICKYNIEGRCKRVVAGKKFKIGMSCLKNKRTLSNMVGKCTVIIEPYSELLSEKDYSYKFDETKNKMYQMPFWKGKSKIVEKRKFVKEDFITELKSTEEQKERSSKFSI